MQPDSPLRILEVVDTLDAGGMEAQLVGLINRLDPNRYHFEVCCLRHEGVHAAHLNRGVMVHALNKQEGLQWSVVRNLRALLRRGYDLIHTHNLAPLIYAAAATWGGRTCPIFHGEHSQFTAQEQGRKRVWQRRLLYRGCTAVHTVSAGQRQELLQAGVSHPRLTAILNGVNTHRFAPVQDIAARAQLRASAGFGNNEELWIGIIARFGSFKGHARLIDAFERLSAQRTNLRLVMIGDGGPEKEKVLAQMNRSPASDQIHWLGFQSDPAPWYRMLDLVTIPSSNEGLSNTTLEAMASGVPVLSNDICGAREMIHEPEGGWVRDLSTADTLTEALEWVVSLPREIRNLAGASGRQRAENDFSWPAMAANYAAWFEACARRCAFPS